MQNNLINSLLWVVAVCIVGCGQKSEVPVTRLSHDQAAHPQPHASAPSDPHGHATHEVHDHHHGFADPVERAKKWNSPDRDTWQQPHQIVAALALKPGATVADIGAGTGYMVAFLSDMVGRDGTVIAIDTESAMIQYLTERSTELGPAKVVPQKVAPDDPLLQSHSVDAVLTLDTWHHVPTREAYAKKVYEGLKPGGRFVVVDYEIDAETGPPKTMRLAADQVARELELAGFRVDVVSESMPQQYMVVGYKADDNRP